MPKILGVSIKENEKKYAVIGLGAIGVIGVMWAMSYLISPGRKHSALPFPLGGPTPPIAAPLGGLLPHMGGGPPPGHPAAAGAKAHLANMLPPRGPPGRSTLGVGGRIAGGLGSGGGMYRWPSGRIGHKGGYGVAGGYYATGY